SELRSEHVAQFKEEGVVRSTEIPFPERILLRRPIADERHRARRRTIGEQPVRTQGIRSSRYGLHRRPVRARDRQDLTRAWIAELRAPYLGVLRHNANEDWPRELILHFQSRNLLRRRLHV